MPIEIAGIKLDRVHRIATLERADFASHRVPGFDGSVVQDMGRDSVRLGIEGIFYGSGAADAVEQLRAIHKARDPVDFLAEIVGQAYFAKVILERFQVLQVAGEPDQFSYLLTISEYVEPPAPAAPAAAGIAASISLEAKQFMDIATLPDLLGSIPEVTNPFAPLSGALTDVQNATEKLDSVTAGLKAIFGIGENP